MYTATLERAKAKNFGMLVVELYIPNAVSLAHKATVEQYCYIPKVKVARCTMRGSATRKFDVCGMQIRGLRNRVKSTFSASLH